MTVNSRRIPQFHSLVGKLPGKQQNTQDPLFDPSSSGPINVPFKDVLINNFREDLHKALPCNQFF